MRRTGSLGRLQPRRCAFTWATSVTGDSEKRLYLLKRATDSWTNFAPDEARSAIEGLDIPAEERAVLLGRLRY